MRGSKLFKGAAVALSVLLLATTVPVVAEEMEDVQPADEMSVNTDIPEAEEIPESGEDSDDMTGHSDDQENEDAEDPIEDLEEDEQIQNLDGGLDGDDTEPGPAEPYSSTDGETEPGPVVEGVVISPVGTTTLYVVGQTVQLTVATTPEEDTIDSMAWSSSNTKVAAVDSNGKVTAGDNNGTATITVEATYNDQTFTDTCTIEVSLSTGFYQDSDSGDWYYYVNGKKSTSTTDVMEGIVDGQSGWWNVVNGKVTRAETVAQNKNGWWYINSNGKVDFSYKGFAKNSYGYWYIEGGKVIFSTNSIIQDTNKKVDGTDGWWYVVGGQVQTSYTGVTNYSNAYGWWYVENGKVNFSANTVAENNNGWWYVEGGKVIFSYNGFGQNKYGWWDIKGGKVNFSTNSVLQDKNKKIDGKDSWWYVVGGQVQTSFTGLANYENENGWWYIKNGKVDFSTNTVAQNNYGWWYVVGGKVQFSYTGVGNYSNAYGWWYIKNGKVDFSATTVAQNNYGWWYVTKGKVDFSFNGIASNSNGSWVIKNGKVDFSYNGTYPYGGVTYNVKNGKASHPAADIGMDMNMYNNAQSQSSSTKWLIMVDVTNCRFGIFQGSKGNWTPYKYWQCTTGASGSPTCIGSYSIYGKGRSFGDSDHTCYWYSQFNGNYLIHSILYYPGTYNVKEGRLGMHLSNGCIRLSYDNAYWVYCNVPYGTRVRTYN